MIPAEWRRPGALGLLPLLHLLPLLLFLHPILFHVLHYHHHLLLLCK